MIQNKKRLFSILLIIIVLLSGCKGEDPYFNGETTIIDHFNKQLSLQGKEITLDSINAGYMSVCDSLLTFASFDYPDGILYVFSLNSGKLLTKLCPKGRGPGEYINFTHTEQYVKDADNIKLWVDDGVKSHILLDLTGSIKTGSEKRDSLIILEGYKISPHGFSLIFTLDEEQILTRIQCEKLYHKDKKYTPERYIMYHKNTQHQVKTFVQFKKPIINPNEIDPTAFYSLNARIKPDKSKLATAMRHLGQINILDIKSGEWKGFRMKNTLDFTSLTSDIKNFNNYYTDVCTDNKYIYALYLNKPIYESNWSSNIIHVFDWEGTPQYEITLSEPVLQITVDNDSGTIYGKNGFEQVFSYHVPTSK